MPSPIPRLALVPLVAGGLFGFAGAQEPSSTQELRRAVRVHLDERDPTGAWEAFRRARPGPIDHEGAKLLRSVAFELWRRGFHRDLIAVRRRVADAGLGLTSTIARMELADAFEEAGLLEEAHATLLVRREEERPRGGKQSLFDLARVAAELGRLDEAADWYARLEALGPVEPDVDVARLWMRLGRWEDALAFWETVATLRAPGCWLGMQGLPPDARPDVEEARCLVALGRTDEARLVLEPHLRSDRMPDGGGDCARLHLRLLEEVGAVPSVDPFGSDAARRALVSPVEQAVGCMAWVEERLEARDLDAVCELLAAPSAPPMMGREVLGAVRRFALEELADRYAGDPELRLVARARLGPWSAPGTPVPELREPEAMRTASRDRLRRGGERWILSLLAELGDEAVIPRALEHLAAASERSERVEALFVLVKLGTPAAYARLRDLRDHGSASEAAAAENVLRRYPEGWPVSRYLTWRRF